MTELYQNGRSVRKNNWQSVTIEKEDPDAKGWFDLDGFVELAGLDSGIYELRVSVKNDRLGKPLQRIMIFGIE